MRTQYKTPAYFDQLLVEAQQKAAQKKASHEALLAGRNLIVPGFEFELSTNLILQLTIRYSRGDQMADIAGLYPEISDHFFKSWDPANVVYRHLFDVLTLGVLVEAPVELFTRIGQLVDEARLRDYLIDYLLAWRKPRPLYPKLRWHTQRQYTGLRQITELSDQAAPARLQEYLINDWYTKSNPDIIYNSHLEADITRNYIGYWSFGVGAISRIMGLEDVTLLNSEYYPYDMVHWQG